MFEQITSDFNLCKLAAPILNFSNFYWAKPAMGYGKQSSLVVKNVTNKNESTYYFMIWH